MTGKSQTTPLRARPADCAGVFRSQPRPGVVPTPRSDSRVRGGQMAAPVYKATWGRIFALVYDTAFILAERRGFREVRKDLVGKAKGRVVELGAGTGLNLEHYSENVSQLLLTEPDPHMAAKLRKRAGSLALDVRVIEAPAEKLPLDDASVDTVISTLVLCTVQNLQQTLAEAARVLRPGGSLL